jgi:ribosome biogenesis GTPase A
VQPRGLASTVNIQWYPGHMHKAQKEIAKRLAQVDLIIEMLDARIPFSSENPMLTTLRGDKRCIKVLNKIDLADANATAIWRLFLESSNTIKTVTLNSKHKESAPQLVAACKNLLPGKAGSIAGIQTLIAGIPNVGKSTTINLLAGRSIAKTGNEPAITKLQQRVNLHNGIVLFDTPGLLWPNVENRNSGYRLAATGAIKDTAMEYEDIGLFLIDYLSVHYERELLERYQLPKLSASAADTLQAIGRYRGCLARGGEIDQQRAAKILVNDFRSGALGKITLELPEIMHRDLAELEIVRAEKSAKRAARAVQRKRR